MGDENINNIISSIVNDKSIGSKWDPASIQRLINDVLSMNQETYILKYRKEDYKQGIRVTFYVERGSVWGQTEPKEEDMVEIAEWCNGAKCGKRTSFDTFYFPNKEAYLMFSLRWQ